MAWIVPEYGRAPSTRRWASYCDLAA